MLRIAWNILVVRGSLVMAAGKVKWFNNAKGYGFILPDGGGDDLFVHYSSIEMDGYKTLKAGQEVEFDLLQGPKGNHAVNIRMMDVMLVDGQAHGSSMDGAEHSNGGAEAPAGAPAVRNGSSEVTS
jgi:cold shock protein